VTHVIVDEVHERSVDSDHLICLLRDVMEQRKDLKVILMSATINAARFSAYFNDCPKLHIPGFTHPVQQYYLEDCLSMVTKNGFFVRGKHEGASGDDALTTKDYQQLSEDGYDEATIRGLKAMAGRDKIEKGVVARVVLHLAMQLLEQSEAEEDGDVTGAILVFLPGMGSISSIHDSLVFGRGLKMEEASVAQEILWVLPLHSAMSPADQQKVFQRPPRGAVKVVLSTNICETSITIDDVVCVVDSARVNEVGYDVATGTSYLREEWCTKAARRQRSGRAGRVRPGECWSLITRKKADLTPAFPAPEIERVSIDQLYLRIESSMANNTSDKYVAASYLPLPPASFIAYFRSLMTLHTQPLLVLSC
jgi:ATP-dependent RNA helicase DHX57